MAPLPRAVQTGHRGGLTYLALGYPADGRHLQLVTDSHRRLVVETGAALVSSRDEPEADGWCVDGCRTVRR